MPTKLYIGKIAIIHNIIHSFHPIYSRLHIHDDHGARRKVPELHYDKLTYYRTHQGKCNLLYVYRCCVDMCISYHLFSYTSSQQYQRNQTSFFTYLCIYTLYKPMHIYIAYNCLYSQIKSNCISSFTELYCTPSRS